MQHYFTHDVQSVANSMSDCTKRRIPFLFAFDFELSEALFIEQPLQQRQVLFRTPLGGNSPALPACSLLGKPCVDFSPETLEAYSRKFAVISNALQRGNSFLANLTVKTPVHTGWSLPDIFAVADAPFCLCVPDRFVCFSPERFVRVSADGVISTNPMKGTISASVPNASRHILSDVKESAEHATIVDLLRNDLSMNAHHVRVERYRYISQIETGRGDILQVSSEVCGRLYDGWQNRLGQILLDMLPAGSVSGAPKKATVDAIRRAEREPRGFYTGVFGFFDGHSLDSAVLIRYIEQDAGGNQFFRSGGGITAKSRLLDEYNEVMQKIYIPVRKPKFSDVICVENGEFLRLDYHQRRVSDTCNRFYQSDLSLSQVTAALPASARRGRYKCRVVYGSAVESVEFAEYHPKKVETVALVYDDSVDYGYKYLDRSALTRLVEASGADDVVIVKNGVITDSSFCNLVFEDAAGNRFTPSEALLKGTYRQWLIDNRLVKAKTIRPADLSGYVYVYFVNAMRSLDNCTKLRVADVKGR